MAEPHSPADAAPRPHIPVMLDEVVAALAPQPGAVILDGTFGAGGYTRALLEAGAQIIALDRDPRAITGGAGLVQEAGGRLTLVESRFSGLDEVAETFAGRPLDGVVLDIGVSSMQLDQPERGFSFRGDGPLDMRMEGRGPSAADLVNGWAEADLARLFWVYGEERRANALARAIVTDRDKAPFVTTRQLAELCGRVIRSRPGDIHPATRAFQALRIAVNRELEELAEALLAAERALRAGGHLVVVTFHSLEDRIVKTFFADRSRTESGGSRHLPQAGVPAATFTLPSRGATAASADEAARNPRARSAKLRAGLRTDAPARASGIDFLGLPSLEPKPEARR